MIIVLLYILEFMKRGKKKTVNMMCKEQGMFNVLMDIIFSVWCSVPSVQVLPDIANIVAKQFLFPCFVVKGNCFIHLFHNI